MAFKPTIRSLSDIQLADGCAVDGIRLDRLLGDTQARHNQLRRGDVGTRWARQVFHLGWEPPLEDPAAALEDRPATKLPFMSVRNANNRAIPPAGTEFTDHGENEWRAKGHDVTVIDPNPGTGTGVAVNIPDQFLWSTALAFPDPVIVDEITLFLENSTNDYDNTFQYVEPPAVGSNPATQITTGPDWVSDLVVQMMVASDLSSNDTDLDDLEVNFWNWRTDARRWMQYSPFVPVPQLFPAHQTFRPEGLVIRLENLNIPLPAFSRVRFNVLVPYYPVTDYDVTGSWEQIPWARQVWDLSLTVLQLIT